MCIRDRSDKADKADKPKKEPKKRAPRRKKAKSLDEIPCPVCGTGHIIKGRTAYGCSRYAEGCAYRLNFSDAPADLTPAKLQDIIEKSKGK